MPSSSAPPTLSGIIERERVASEQGIAVLEDCIAAAKAMLESGAYDSKVASHLSWLLNGRVASLEKLRKFGETVKVQSLELTPEQTMRAVAKFIQTLPATVRSEMRVLLDAPIDDIELIA